MSNKSDVDIRKKLVATFTEKTGPVFSDEIESLREKHSKICYQKISLLSALEKKQKLLEEKPVVFDIQLALKFLLSEAVSKLGLESVSDIIVNPSGSDCDFKCCDAMKLAKMNNKKPKEIADKILGSLPESFLVESVSVKDPGFLNIQVGNLFMQRFVCDIILNGVKPIGVPKKKVIVELSSPNIAKEMHVGHLRSTIIGDALARLYEFLGCEVLRPSHIGDWGTQFGMLIAYLERENPNLEFEYSNVTDLQSFYRASKKVFDTDPEFKKRSLEMVVKLQKGDPEVRRAWQNIVDVSLKEFHKIYDRLDVKLYEEGESFFQSRMDKIIKKLQKKGVVTFEDGCQVVYLKDLDVPPLYFVKSDGGYTYATSDMATLKYRIDELKVDTALYVVDKGQSEHFNGIFTLAKQVGWYNPSVNNFEHVSFGVVLGEDKKKFKTRSGDTVKLVHLLDEGVERAKNKIRSNDWSEEEIQKNAEAIAYSCIRYADLSHSRNLDYVFSFDKMLEDRGNTAVYLLYGMTRIKAILRKTKVSEEMICEYVEKILKDKDEFVFESNEERVLLQKIINYPIAVRRMLNESSPHLLCEYIYELTVKFNEFYERCKCFVRDESGELQLNMNRLALCYSVLKVLNFGFSIVGIRTDIERM